MGPVKSGGVILKRLAARFQLSIRALVAVAGLAMVFGVAVIGFGGLTEDVAAHNGQQHFDFRRLDWFVNHRNHAEVRMADLLAKMGAVGVMAAFAILAAVLLWRRRASIALVL